MCTTGPSSLPQCKGRSTSPEDGSALITVLVLIAIASTLVGLVLGLATLRHEFVQRDVHRLQARYAAEAGVYHALDRIDTDLREMEAVIDVATGASSTAPCSVQVEPYGGFARVRSSATVRGQRWTLDALAGREAPADAVNALVFGDPRSNVTITGRTRITGPRHVGPRGVETSPLRGERFTGTLDGRADRDPQVALPDFDDAPLQETLRRAQRQLRTPPPGAAAAFESPEDAPVVQGRRVFFVNGSLELTEADSTLTRTPALFLATGSATLKGTLRLAEGSMVIAGETLTVTGDVEAAHALLVGASGVYVGGQPRLSAQLLSETQVFIGGDAHLTYPSLAYVADADGRIFVNGRAKVDGWILFPNRPEGRTNRDPEVRLADSTLVRGVVYNASMTELHGDVHGTVMARQFGFYLSPTHYVNWIKDATINVTKRPQGLHAPYGFTQASRPRVLSWREERRPTGPVTQARLRPGRADSLRTDSLRTGVSKADSTTLDAR